VIGADPGYYMSGGNYFPERIDRSPDLCMCVHSTGVTIIIIGNSSFNRTQSENQGLKPDIQVTEDLVVKKTVNRFISLKIRLYD
jgi:hypothetical protein